MTGEHLWDVSIVEHTPDLAVRVPPLVEQATATDAVGPLNEQAHRILAGQLPGTHVLAEQDGQVLGYAQVDHADASVQLFVAPAARRRGIGAALAEVARHQEPGLQWWSFGTTDGARALAARLGLTPVRGLLKMSTTVAEHTFDHPGPAPEGITVTTFTAADIDDLVEVNALAFAEHPEQGRMSRRDVEDKVAEEWFEGPGLFLARNQDGALLGYHWTKTEGDIGEVYVIGVHPFEHGRGLGRYLLELGLHHLATTRGVRVIDLYVEAANQRVVTMYENAGFREVQRDTRWA
ncbi:mycothiol synthase [Propionibacteriaceae bacterium Y1923]